jgi:replicative DNA helicase
MAGMIEPETLPKNREAEQAVLGAMMFEAETVVPLIRAKLTADQFYWPQHSAIYRAVLGLAEAGKPVDLITVGNRLEETGQLAEAGGRTYLSEIYSKVTTTTSVEHYAGIVTECARKRELHQIGLELASASLNGVESSTIVARSQQRLEKLGTNASAISDTAAHFDFGEVDAPPEESVIEGLVRSGDLTLWAGYEKHKKSTLVLQACLCMAAGKPFLGFAIVKPIRVLYIDAESSPALLARRWQSVKFIFSDEEIARVKKNLTIIRGRDLLAKGVSLSLDQGQYELAGLIKKSNAEMIVLDPLRVFHSAEEDKSGPMTEMLSAIRHWAAGRNVIIVHHCRKRSNQSKATIHLKDDPYTWSDNVRGSNVLKAHCDGIVLQEIVNGEDGDELLYLAAILKDNPNLAPIPLIESEASPFWLTTVADQSVAAAQQLLPERDRQIYDKAVAYLKENRIARRVALAECLMAAGIPRATAFKKIAHLGRLGLLVVEDGSVTLPLNP